MFVICHTRTDLVHPEGLDVPEAVPQQGGTHQAEEKILLMTSGGNRVTFLCTCSRLSTRARKTPTEKSMAPRITRFVVLHGRTRAELTERDRRTRLKSSVFSRDPPEEPF